VFEVTGTIGTLFSGWHFVDDHEFLELVSEFNMARKINYKIIRAVGMDG